MGTLTYKDSVMAKGFDYNGKVCKKAYYKDETICYISIENVLKCLVHNNYGFMGKKPTKEELKKALELIKKEQLEMFSDDFDFYAEHVIGKFLEATK